MHSSISPSEREVPDGQWGQTLLIAVLITCLVVGGAETIVRRQGYQPTVPDTRELWSFHRSRIYDDEGKSVVLLGASRMQTGFSPRVFRNRFHDYHLTQLAVSATSPLATLKDLANDDRFVGIVLCSLSPSALQEGVEGAHSQSRNVEHYREQRHTWNVEERLKLQFVNSHFAIARPQFRLRPLIRQFITGTEFAAPGFISKQLDRSQRLDFQKVDVEKQRARRVGGTIQFYEKYVPETPSREDWMATARALKPYIDRIKSRGGAVVLIRFPETGEHWRLSVSHFPKEEFWDQLSELTGAPTIHFKDVPGLAIFDCPDTSHLDYRDTDAFTNALLDECVRQKILPDHE